MNKLNKTFIANQILTAEELNAITVKVDEIVELLSSLDSDNPTITDAQVPAKVDAVKDEINRLLNDAIAKAQIGFKANSSDFEDLIKDLENLTLVVNGKAAIEDLTALKATVDELNVTGGITTTYLESGDGTFYGTVKAKELLLDKSLAINNGTVEITSNTTEDGGYGAIDILEGGSLEGNSIYASLSSRDGLKITMGGDGSGSGGFQVGKLSDGSFGMRINGPIMINGQAGFTDTVNGLKFINGICVGKV